MRGAKKILYILGKIIKWFFLIEALIFVVLLFSEIVRLSVDGIAIYLLCAALCALIAFVGYRMEKFIKDRSAPAAVKKPVTTLAPPPQKELDAQPVYRPVTTREARVSKGEFQYKFKKGTDLFAHGKEGLAYPELLGNFQITANLGKHILDTGGVIRGISVGGGIDEVSHTGAVAYSAGYQTLEAFVQNCMKDMDDAEAEAGREYGGWFSSLDFKYILIDAQIKQTAIKVEVSCFVPAITVSIRLGTGSEGFAYLIDLVRAFGAKGFHQGVGADELFWDGCQKVFRRTFQLEETRTFFWTSFMDAEGVFTKYVLDEETAEDSHYEISPGEIDRLKRLLQKETNQKYPRSPEESCAYYLQRHTGWELIALLKRHALIKREVHF